MGNVSVDINDILTVVGQVSNYLIAIGVVLALAIVAAIVATVKIKKPLKGLVIGNSIIAFVLITVIIVNMMLGGPLYNTLNTVLTDAGTLSEETVEQPRKLIEEITNEGIILAKNDNNALPLAPSNLNNGQINVFGWASTNPIYGGTGSGAVDVSTAVDILGGLKNAGFAPNQELVDLVTSNFDNVIVVYNGANTMEMGWTEEYEQIKSVLLVAGPGATGFNALGNIIAGTVNPSGKTIDLWARDLTAAPWYNNIGHFNYTDAESLAIAAAAKETAGNVDGYVTFVDYVENIYTST